MAFNFSAAPSSDSLDEPNSDTACVECKINLTYWSNLLKECLPSIAISWGPMKGTLILEFMHFIRINSVIHYSEAGEHGKTLWTT